MTPNANQPTHLFVRNLLGTSDSPDAIYDNLTLEQRRDLVLVRIADEISAVREHGCDKRNGDLQRVAALENFMRIAKGVIYGIAGASAVVGFIFMVIEFVARYGGHATK